jgi:hypothetical protein
VLCFHPLKLRFVPPFVRFVGYSFQIPDAVPRRDSFLFLYRDLSVAMKWDLPSSALQRNRDRLLHISP